MTGIEWIAFERTRQLAQQPDAVAQEDDLAHGELALAAICYATPVQLYLKKEQATSLAFEDPWPPNWDAGLDKRFSCGERKDSPKNRAPDPATYTHEERLDLLVRAGTLIAAEIDRLQRLRKPKSKTFSQRWLFLCDLSTRQER